ncbi:MAG: LLM class flavin-dependent oxidoreductase [Chloroflexota bacterium]
MTTPLRIGFKVSPAHIGWQRMHDMWRRAGELGVFDSAWLFDHFYPVDGDGSCFEATTSLAGLIHLVPGLQVGHLVLANPYRHPALTAKMASVFDHMSGGRFVLGLGAGWHVPETQAYGMDLDPLGQRLRDLRAAVLVIRELLKPAAGAWPTDGSDSSTSGGVSLEAPPYRLRHARNDPLPVQGIASPSGWASRALGSACASSRSWPTAGTSAAPSRPTRSPRASMPSVATATPSAATPPRSRSRHSCVSTCASWPRVSPVPAASSGRASAT